MGIDRTLHPRGSFRRHLTNQSQQCRSPYTIRGLTDEYIVQHQKKKAIDPASKVFIPIFPVCGRFECIRCLPRRGSESF